MLAEDNPGDVLLVRAALEEAGLRFDLVVKKDGEEMLRFVDAVEGGLAECPAVAILDLNLPKYSGAVVLERMRDSQAWGNVRVVIVTSSNSESDRGRVGRLRVNGYFRKPTDYDEFMRLGEIVRGLAGGSGRV